LEPGTVVHSLLPQLREQAAHLAGRLPGKVGQAVRGLPGEVELIAGQRSFDGLGSRVQREDGVVDGVMQVPGDPLALQGRRGVRDLVPQPVSAQGDPRLLGQRLPQCHLGLARGGDPLRDDHHEDADHLAVLSHRQLRGPAPLQVRKGLDPGPGRLCRPEPIAVVVQEAPSPTGEQVAGR
jgi:hypothetical protein